MIVKLLTEHHLEFLSLKGGCTGSSKSTHVKIPHCWKSHATAQKIHDVFSVSWQSSSVYYSDKAATESKQEAQKNNTNLMSPITEIYLISSLTKSLAIA